jgi:peptidoglycan/xylan/chitin deacetylase (PgdA/CDA1 family)
VSYILIDALRRRDPAMRELAKSTLLSLYKYSGALAVQERVSYWFGNDFLPILLFHRVTDEIPPDGLTVTTAWFRGLCQLLRKRFHVVSLSEAMHILESRQRLPRRMAAITFDDCYRDNLFAARILAEHKLPACFFIPSAFPGTNHRFPWDNGLRPLPNLSWLDIREMANLGHEIGSHTVHHADIAQLSGEETRRELVDSKKTLEENLGRPVRWFAYPFGTRANFPRERLSMVYEAGYRGCFSGFGGFARPGIKEQIIPRIPVPYFRSLLNLELYLTGCLGWVYSLKRKIGMI